MPINLLSSPCSPRPHFASDSLKSQSHWINNSMFCYLTTFVLSHWWVSENWPRSVQHGASTVLVIRPFCFGVFRHDTCIPDATTTNDNDVDNPAMPNNCTLYIGALVLELEMPISSRIGPKNSHPIGFKDSLKWWTNHRWERHAPNTVNQSKWCRPNIWVACGCTRQSRWYNSRQKLEKLENFDGTSEDESSSWKNTCFESPRNRRG